MITSAFPIWPCARARSLLRRDANDAQREGIMERDLALLERISAQEATLADVGFAVPEDDGIAGGSSTTLSCEGASSYWPAALARHRRLRVRSAGSCCWR